MTLFINYVLIYFSFEETPPRTKKSLGFSFDENVQTPEPSSFQKFMSDEFNSRIISDARRQRKRNNYDEEVYEIVTPKDTADVSVIQLD